jgi:polyisoprenoid-binding protein YceI
MVNISQAIQRTDIPAAGRYRIDPARSSVAVRTRHMFGLAAVSGTMSVTAGDITLEPAVPQASVTAAVSASSFSTGNKKRDGDVRKKKFLNVAAYPEFTFRAGRLAEAQNRWTVTGELTVCGVIKPVTLAIESVEIAGQGFVARAKTRIDRYAFGVTAAKGMAARYLDVVLIAAADPV